MTTEDARWRLGVGEIVALVFVGVELLVMLGMELLWIPHLSRMYRDMGNAALPGFTKLIVRGWWVLPWLVANAGAAVVALAGVKRARVRGVILVITAIAGAIVLATTIWGLYMPIFELAGKIKD